MSNGTRFYANYTRILHLSLFEKVILANSLMLLGEALAGLWITSHNLEAHHYLIDTSFIVVATLLSLLINVLLIRAFLYPGLAKALIRAYVSDASFPATDPASPHQDRAKASSLAQALRVLTPREVEILRLVAEGRTNQQIADQLVLCIKRCKHTGPT